jgi:hypothetical protein
MPSSNSFIVPLLRCNSIGVDLSVRMRASVFCARFCISIMFLLFLILSPLCRICERVVFGRVRVLTGCPYNKPQCSLFFCGSCRLVLGCCRCCCLLCFDMLMVCCVMFVVCFDMYGVCCVVVWLCGVDWIETVLSILIVFEAVRNETVFLFLSVCVFQLLSCCVVLWVKVYMVVCC